MGNKTYGFEDLPDSFDGKINLIKNFIKIFSE